MKSISEKSGLQAYPLFCGTCRKNQVPLQKAAASYYRSGRTYLVFRPCNPKAEQGSLSMPESRFPNCIFLCHMVYGNFRWCTYFQ